MKSIKPEEFFKLIAINAGVTDIQNVKDIYYGMIKVMSRELRGTHIIRLPDWGDFRLKIHKARMCIDINDRTMKKLPAKPVVKFIPCEQVKQYFYELGNYDNE